MRRRKFGKIQKFSVAFKIWLKLWEFWPFPTSKGWNLTKSRKILICVKNFAQKWDFWPLLTCEGWNFAKSRNFDSCQTFSSKLTFLPTWEKNWKFGAKFVSFANSGHAKDDIWQNPEIFSCVENLAKKWEFWQLRTSKGWNLTKSRKNFDLCWKSGSKMRFLTTPDLRRMKYCKIKTILIHVQNLAQNWHFWPLGTYERWNLAKWRNFEWPWKFGSKLRVLTTLDLRRIKFGEIRKFKAVLKIWLKKEIFDKAAIKAWPAKDEIWQNPQILSHVENFAQNWNFWLLRTCEGYEIWQNPEILSRVVNLAQNEISDHSEPAKDEIGQNQEILNRLENLAKNGHFWLLGTCEGGNFVKFRNCQSHFKFWSKLRVSTIQNLQRTKFDKSRNFESCWKFGLKNIHFWPRGTCEEWNLVKFRNFQPQSKFRQKLKGKVSSLSDHPMIPSLPKLSAPWMKLGKIQKFWVMLKILPKIEIFDHSGHMQRIWNLAKSRNFKEGVL